MAKEDPSQRRERVVDTRIGLDQGLKAWKKAFYDVSHLVVDPRPPRSAAHNTYTIDGEPNCKLLGAEATRSAKPCKMNSHLITSREGHPIDETGNPRHEQ